MIDHINAQIALYLRAYPDDLARTQPVIDQLAADGENILLRSNMTGHITTSMFVLSHDMRSGLVIAHKHIGLWLQPGGHYEPGETLFGSAAREVEEETGVVGFSFLQPFPLDIDTHSIPARPAKNEGVHRHHDFVYLGWAPADATLIAQEEEVDGVKWVALEELAQSHSRMQTLARKAISYIVDEK